MPAYLSKGKWKDYSIAEDILMIFSNMDNIGFYPSISIYVFVVFFIVYVAYVANINRLLAAKCNIR